MQIDYRKELNEQQYEAATTMEGPLLILAAAGSGKTRTLIYRVSYMIESGINPENILLLTFTNKAANEMKERAQQMLDERCGKITASTYHSFCAKILRKYSRLVGIEPHFTIIDGNDADDIISMLKTERNYHKIRGFPKSSVIASVISASVNRNWPIARAVDRLCRRYGGYVSQIEELEKAFAEYKKNNDMMDYDDLLVHMLTILRNYPSVREYLSETYQYIMVDEYQDTNYLQEQIIFALREDNRNLAVVGDDFQCIYGFRGSNVQNIITFPDKMPGCRKICLTKNYRSNQEILDLSNHVMKVNATEGFYKEMQGLYKAKVHPKIVHVGDSRAESRYIIGEILNRLAVGETPGSICVLIRNSFQSYELERLLNSQKIPFEKYGGLKFFDKAHVKDVLAFIRCLVNDKDEIAWYRILQLLPGIGKTYSRRISSACHDEGMSALTDPAYERRRFYSEMNRLHDHLQRMIRIDFEMLLPELIDYYYELCKLTIQKMNTAEENRQVLLDENEFNKIELGILTEMAKSYMNAVDFLTDLSLDNGKDEQKDADKLIISTIHSAKGLEFDTVFMMDCIDEVCPSTTVEDVGSDSDSEELRCFYVAMTRAKKNLYMMVPAVMSKYGQIIPGRMAHYLTASKDFVSEKYA